MNLALIALVACSNDAPTLLDISDQAASVGVQLQFEVVGADADGDELEWAVTSDTLDDIATRGAPATLTPYEPAAALFRWTPLAGDIGTHTLIITGSDRRSSADVPVEVTVGSGAAVPVFRQPLGEGTTLDLREDDCIAVDVVVEDGDDADVYLGLEEPIEENFSFDQDQPMAGVFEFCPSDKQIEAADRYPVTFIAEDDAGNVARKKYLIVLRKELLSGCPGDAPVVIHSPPGPQATVQDIVVEATIGDDMGVAGDPVLYFSTEQPADPANPDFSTFTQVDMKRDSGSATSGTYEGSIANPVLSEPVGATASVYYFIEASDNDDEAGPCDHRTTAPEGDVYELEVERPSSGTALGTCEPCSADVQCDSGRCIATGGGDMQCLEACGGAGDCSTGTCSDVAWVSVDGAIGKVCLVDEEDCGGETCVEDGYEDNDTLDDPGVDVLSAGSYPDLTICPDGTDSVDDDFFGLLLDDPTPVSATLAFEHDDGDLDLQLLDDGGGAIDSSTGVTDSERVEACLDPGLYFLRVYSAFAVVSTSYDLELDLPSGGCCTDDAAEPDSGAFNATYAYPGDFFDDRNICPGDEDWYEVDLYAGETLEVTLLFDQTGPEHDLDIHLLDSSGIDLTPCPPCDIDNGQSGSPDEYFEWDVGATDTYYVVIKGFEDGAAEYLLGIDVR